MLHSGSLWNLTLKNNPEGRKVLLDVSPSLLELIGFLKKKRLSDKNTQVVISELVECANAPDEDSLMDAIGRLPTEAFLTGEVDKNIFKTYEFKYLLDAAARELQTQLHSMSGFFQSYQGQPPLSSYLFYNMVANRPLVVELPY